MTKKVVDRKFEQWKSLGPQFLTHKLPSQGGHNAPVINEVFANPYKRPHKRVYIYITGVISPLEIHGENVRAVHIHLKGKTFAETEFTSVLMTLHVNLQGCVSRYLAVFV